ncbi:hypothetical protein [Streptomyces sp. CBMA123]|uniref:hypothetical protein n=1 Tax=Streptomyces sp. CBMA123 TaxID=1896313 RepID=UPI001661EEF8|nr:hypothetical protein [Streptomyces sp. CBMA123]MBD0688484.1 hypothetical protein [Streptomyces sp. CBMA123]
MPQNDLTASTRKSLGEAIGDIARTAVLVRIFPERRAATYLFELDFHRMFLGRNAEEDAARLIRRTFGNVADWRLAHDFYRPTGELYLTPEPHQDGYIPEDDQSFGLAPTRIIAIFDGNSE